MLSPAVAYKRWRHGRGFGVHSPLGFYLIDTVLRSRHASYYGEKAAVTTLSGVPPRTVRAAYRLIADCDPRSAVIISDTRHQAWQTVLDDIVSDCRMLTAGDNPDSSSAVTIPEADVIIVDTDRDYRLPDDNTSTRIRLTVATGLNQAWRRRHWDDNTARADYNALIIDSLDDIAFSVRRRGLPRQVIIAKTQ